MTFVTLIPEAPDAQTKFNGGTDGETALRGYSDPETVRLSGCRSNSD